MVKLLKISVAVVLFGLVACAQAAGTGLTGDYFAATNFTGTKNSRVDATVDFNWGTSSPGFGGLGTNNFSIRWSGQVEPRYDGLYTFYVTADDGAALWVNDRLIVSRLQSAAPAQMGGQISLRANERVNLRLEYLEKTGSASVRLEWTSASQTREVIPQSQLYPTTLPAERGTILREHWANLPGTAITNLTGSTNYPSKPDGRETFLSFECLQQNWATNVGTRMVGYVVPRTNGVFTFAVAASDRAELWLSTNANSANKQLIASVTNATTFRNWSNHVSQVSTGRTLVAWQKYYVELLHKAGTNNNHYSVAWQPPGAAQFSVIDGSHLVPIGLTNSLPSQANILNTLVPAHPRLFATAERFNWLKQQVATNPAGQPAVWYASIYKSATNLFTAATVTYSPDNRGTILDESRTVKDRMYQLGIAWKISGDTNFPERAWTELNAAGNFPDWHPGHFLDTAEMTHGFAIGYDWFYEYWTTTRRTFILTNITTKGLTEGLQEFTNNVWWSQSTGNNWNMVCNGGLTLGALAVGADAETTAEQTLSKTIPSQAPVMQHWNADNGGWYEGPGYWDYASDYNFRMLAGLQSALGTDFGLSTTNGFNNAGLFTMLLASANKRSFNFADGGGTGISTGPQMFWWARRFDVPAYSYFQRTNGSADALGALWWDGRGGTPASENIGSDFLFLGPTGVTPFDPQHVGVFRSSWGDTNETMLSFKGGEMGAAHGNLDAGDFVLEALGKRWAWNLGGDDYALPGYFNDNPASATNRWDYYRMRAEGQNTLVINPGNGPDTKLGPVAPVITFQSKDGVRALAVMDLTPIETNVVRAWRGLQLFGPQRKQVLIQDEIAGGTNANVWWFMHYQSSSTQVALSPDGTSVTMTQGSNRLWGKILSSGGTFQIMSARPLPTSPDPGGQNLNASYQKLAIHLTGVSNTTIAVWFVPLAPGQNPPLVPPTLTPLAQWQIPESDPPVAMDGNVTTPQNTAVEVDLTTLASDTVTADSNLVFTVTSPTNGTVALLPDGRTARFTPATNFYGTGQYLYTVTDEATNSLTAGVIVTVLPAAWYWDTATSAGLQAANGTWDGATAAWSGTSAGSNPLLAWPPPGNDAVFIGAGGSYAVTINGTQAVNQISTTNGAWTFNGGALNHASGALIITANGDTALNSPLSSATDFTKLGTNRLTLGAPMSFPGDVFVPTGTLRSTASNALPVAASLTLGADNTAGALDFAASQSLSSLTVITTNSALTNVITIATGQTLKIAGPVTVGVDNGSISTTRMRMSGGGALVVTNAAEDFTVGYGVAIANITSYGNTASLDCSKLGSVTLGTTNAPLDELRVGYGNGTGGTTHTLTLSDTNNHIVATTVHVGNSTKNNGSAGTVMLGSGTNIIVTDTLNIGLCKVAGTVKFASQTAGSPGTVTIGGKSGPAAAIWIGYKNGTGTAGNPASTLDLRGHNATITASSLSIGIEDGSGTGGDSGSLYFDGGTFTVTNVTLGSKSGSSTGIANGSLNLSGGTFTVFPGGSFILGYQTNTGTATATLNLTGGTLNSQVDILDGGGGSNTSTFTLNGGTLNLFGRKLGSTTNINTLNFQSGTLSNVSGINGSNPLVKTGAGTLTVGGTNTYSGSTIIGGGTLLVTGSIAAGAVTVSNTAVLGGSGTINGPTVVKSGGTLKGGDVNSSNTLTVANSLTLGDTNNAVTYSRFLVAAGGKISANSLTVAGTNIVNILDGSLPTGTNTLFTYGGGSIGGSGFAGFQLGTIPAGVNVQLIDAGSAIHLVVLPLVNTNSPVLTNSYSGGTLTLSWPADRLGWRLQVQTNFLNVGLSTNWSTWPGSTNVTSVLVTNNPANPSMFFRLVYP